MTSKVISSVMTEQAAEQYSNANMLLNCLKVDFFTVQTYGVHGERRP